jgi:hypothetical protein
MSDTEFDLLDELYFVQSLAQLQQSLGWGEGELKQALAALAEKGWVRCAALLDGQEPPAAPDILAEGEQYLYLATKAGLLAHNSR